MNNDTFAHECFILNYILKGNTYFCEKNLKFILQTVSVLIFHEITHIRL